MSERSALVTAPAPRQLCAPLHAARRQLRRFLAPLQDVATALGLAESSRQRVQRFVLLGMLEPDTDWGCWDATIWIEVAHSAGFYRANVLAVGARLGAITGRDVVRLCGMMADGRFSNGRSPCRGVVTLNSQKNGAACAAARGPWRLATCSWRGRRLAAAAKLL